MEKSGKPQSEFCMNSEEMLSSFARWNWAHILAVSQQLINASVKQHITVLLGVNSGVMLMNLTRMRACAWTRQMVSYYENYRYQITWGDQDLINIFFHFFPGTYRVVHKPQKNDQIKSNQYTVKLKCSQRVMRRPESRDGYSTHLWTVHGWWRWSTGVSAASWVARWCNG